MDRGAFFLCHCAIIFKNACSLFVCLLVCRFFFKEKRRFTFTEEE